MKQGHVQFHFMCKLYVGPKGMQADYTVYSPISISMEKRDFLLVQCKIQKQSSICLKSRVGSLSWITLTGVLKMSVFH